MKKPYQIEAQRAVKQLDAMATDGNPTVQIEVFANLQFLRFSIGERAQTPSDINS